MRDDERPLPIEAPSAGGARRWTWGVGGICAVILLCGLCLASPFLLVIGSVLASQAFIAQNEAAMRDPAVATPVARTLALYCQSDQRLFPEHLDGGWVPQELARIGPHAWGSVSATSASFELGGGFYHYGYGLHLDQAASTTTARVWRLALHRENQPSETVATVTLAPSERLSADELFALLVVNHDARISRAPDQLGPYQQKLDTCGRFGKRADGRAVLDDMVGRFPDEWFPRLVLALVVAETDPAAAEAGLRAWVDGKPDLFRCLDLAYYHQLRGEPAKAAAAAQRATQHEAETEWGHGGNSEHRGYSAARYAYETGHLDVAIALCDHLLPVKINGTYAKASLRELRDAAAAAKAGGAPAKLGWEGMSQFDPFGSANSADIQFDLDALLGRKVARPTWRDD